MAEKGGVKAAMMNKGGGKSGVKVGGGGKTGVGAPAGAMSPSPKAAQKPSALIASRKSDDKVAKRGGKNGPDK